MQDLKKYKAISHILIEAGCLSVGEKVSIIYDKSTSEIAKCFSDVVLKIGGQLRMVCTPECHIHGIEPSQEAAIEMLSSDLIVGLTATSMAHTQARKNACINGARYLSLPEYSLDLLNSDSIFASYRARKTVVDAVANRLTKSKYIRVTTKQGTDIKLNTSGRIGNSCPGMVEKSGDLGSPPDIEANISPVEDYSEGIIVVDGSIPCPKIGLLEDNMELVVKGGKIVSFFSKNKSLERLLKQMFLEVEDEKAYILAECGIGLNEKSKLTGNMLTDEGAQGTLHFGFGSNHTVGGINKVSFHLDFVIKNPNLWCDEFQCINNGELYV